MNYRFVSTFFIKAEYPVIFSPHNYEDRNFGRKSEFWSKIKNLVENQTFGRKSDFWSKIEILVENRNFGQKSKFWSKIEILVTRHLT